MKNRDGAVTAAGFIVVWDDQQGVCAVMGWDDDCPGALCSSDKAIRVSTAFSRLCREQGAPVNDDFIGDCLRNVKILPLRRAAS